MLGLIRSALHEVAPDCGERCDGLTLSSRVGDLGIDSVLRLEMIGVIEDRLVRTFEEHEIARVVTLEDIATLIRDGRVGSP